MNDYQMPLFDRYDMSVEFERHWALIQRGLVASSSEPATLDEQLLEATDYFDICHLEIFPDYAQLTEEWEELVHCGANVRRFSLEVPYRGDDELWHLYPSKVVTGLLGETYRGHLILTCSGQSEDHARVSFDRRLAEIATVISQQKKRIQLFEEMVPTLVKAETLKLRIASTAKFVGLNL